MMRRVSSASASHAFARHCEIFAACGWGRRARKASSVGEVVDEYAGAPFSVNVLFAVVLSASIIVFSAAGFEIADGLTEHSVSCFMGKRISRKSGEHSSGMMGKVTFWDEAAAAGVDTCRRAWTSRLESRTPQAFSVLNLNEGDHERVLVRKVRYHRRTCILSALARRNLDLRAWSCPGERRKPDRAHTPRGSGRLCMRWQCQAIDRVKAVGMKGQCS